MRDIETTLILLCVVYMSIALHEFGHAKSADSAGDPTPRLMGRVTLNPFAHFDPVGAVLIAVLAFSGYGLGWGKPVLVNPSKMQHPRWDHFMSVLWGPLTNVIIAVVFGFLFRFAALPSGSAFFVALCIIAVTTNVALCLFNLIPLGPLDGHWLVGLALPQPMGQRFILWNRTTGTFVLIGLIVVSQMSSSFNPIGMLMSGPVMTLTDLILGLPTT